MNYFHVSSIRRALVGFLVVALILQSCPAPLWAQVPAKTLPAVNFSASIHIPDGLPALKGLILNRKDPFQLAFILGNGAKSDEENMEASRRLAGYFLASLAVPEKDTWVTH
ncbi:MAG: hypothetical protein HQL20_10975 [Candidatus Omnitrophica bacterium]|nr:hypothetical protein [Candidatus Omnitrophota bacterium]